MKSAAPPSAPRPTAPAPAVSLLSVADAAKELRVSRARVHQLIRKGVLRASRLTPKGRYLIPREWLLEAVFSREVKPQPAGAVGGAA